MIKRLIAWIETRIAIRKVRAAKIPLDSKCPACGHTGVDLSVSYQFKDQKPKVGLTCRVCKNLWFREPIVNAEKWAPKLQELKKP